MRCLKPIKAPNGQIVNCNQCLNCRINYTSGWTLRCLYELNNWDSASFITLTYNDENLPKDKGLNPQDLTNFWKRLRFNLSDHYGGKYPIKYYACGEYGSRTMRPHYHAIVFGLDNYNDEHRKILTESWNKCDPFLFAKNRKDSAMLPVCREDIAYVCGYVQKKLKGVMADEVYGDKLRPFTRCSAGIGLDFALSHQKRLTSNGFTYLNGKRIAIPRYLRDKLGIQQRELINKIDISEVERVDKELFQEFKDYLVSRHLWYPDNLTMMSIRFQRFLDDKQYEYCHQIEQEFFKKQKIRGKL